jgi:hypothetical protein
MKTIVSHIPEAKSNIVATQFSKLQGAETPHEVLRKLHDVFKNQGFEFYRTPDQDALAKQLANAIQRKENITKILPKRFFGYDIFPERTKEKSIIKSLKKEN